MSAPQWYLDGLDQIDQDFENDRNAEAALRRRLGLICDLYVSEGGTREGYLKLLTQAELPSV